MNIASFRRRVLRVLLACKRKYYWSSLGDDLLEDGISVAICEALGWQGSGMTDEQVFKSAASAGVNFLAREVYRRRKYVPDRKMGLNGDEYYTLDYLTDGARSTQEQECDARKARRIIASDEIAEMIAYGDKTEGGVARIRAEREVREKLGTYRRATPIPTGERR